MPGCLKDMQKVSRNGRDPLLWILKTSWQKSHFTFLKEKVSQCIGRDANRGLCSGAPWCQGEHWHEGPQADGQSCPCGMDPLRLPSGPLQLQRIVCSVGLIRKLKACSQSNKALQNVLCSLHNCSRTLIIYDNISECTNCMQQTL